MKVIVNITYNFKKEAKLLLKRYRSLASDLAALEDDLYLRHALGNNAYKIRLKISSKGKGKTGGARVISYVETDVVFDVESDGIQTTVNLISNYDKSETDSISDKELKRLIANIK